MSSATGTGGNEDQGVARAFTHPKTKGVYGCGNHSNSNVCSVVMLTFVGLFFSVNAHRIKQQGYPQK